MGPQDAEPACVWAGARHDWCVLTGQADSDVMQWILADEVFTVGSGHHADLKLDFSKARASSNVKTEEDRKFIMSGGLASGSCSVQMCGLSLKDNLPSSRLQSWFRAFKLANKASVGASDTGEVFGLLAELACPANL